MYTKKAIFPLVILLFLSSVASVFAAPVLGEENTRYFVQSNRAFWKSALGVRHSFVDGFTTDLSDWQLRFAKIAGLKVFSVKKLNILPSQEVAVESPKPLVETVAPSVTPETVQQSEQTDEPGLLDVELFGKSIRRLLSRRPVPFLRVPWGVKMVYNDSLLNSTSGGAGARIAVLDTGIFSEHPDLKDHIVDCKDFTQLKSPVVNGKCEDKNGHGTHVAGIIGADGGGDELGIYGVAPDADLLAYKVCSNSGTCWSDDIAVAIKTAADSGVQVINLSLGSDSPSSLIQEAVSYAYANGVLVVAAAGNDGPYQDSVDYPAALPEVIAVGAIDGGRNVPDWSSHGVNTLTEPFVVEEGDIEFAAPGVNIESTWKDGSYAILSGTSMAAPHVAGLAAKLWQFDAENPAQATRDLLHAMSNDIIPLGDDDASGFGLPSL